MDEVANKTTLQPTIYPNLPTTLKAVGCDEYWLKDWITADPTRLGLGQVTIKAKELRQHAAKPDDNPIGGPTSCHDVTAQRKPGWV